MPEGEIGLVGDETAREVAPISQQDPPPPNIATEVSGPDAVEGVVMLVTYIQWVHCLQY